MTTMDEAVQALRAFNRFHTRFAGVLDRSFMGSGLSLVEARVLYEIAQHQPTLASAIRANLGLDAGYLSRIVARLEAKGWLERGRGKDARQRPISMTEQGRAAYDALDARTQKRAEDSLVHLSPAEHAELVKALRTATALLSKGAVVLDH